MTASHAGAAAPILTRSRPAAPVRIVHVGIGAFHRAHQAWYTAHATDADQWGIAGFTGRSPEIADQLSAQDSVYTLVERSAGEDRFETIESIVEAHHGDDIARLIELICRPEVAIVTLTVTEAGYVLGADGYLRIHDPLIVADLAAVRASRDAGSTPTPRSAVARLVVALAGATRRGRSGRRRDLLRQPARQRASARPRLSCVRRPTRPRCIGVAGRGGRVRQHLRGPHHTPNNTRGPGHRADSDRAHR